MTPRGSGNDAGEKYCERDFDSRLTGIKQTSIRIQQPANAAVAKKMLSGPKSKKAELDYHRPEKTPTGRGWSAHSDRHFGKRCTKFLLMSFFSRDNSALLAF